MVKFYDTILGEYIQNPWIRGLSLDKLSEKYFDYEMIHYDEITEKWKINFGDIPLDLASKYSAEDVYMTYKLFKKQEKEKVLDNKVLQNIEIPLMEVLKNMEISGVKVDRDRLKELETVLETEIKILGENIFELAGEEFNISSPKQVWEILFEKLELPKWKKTKTGYSVGVEVLEWLSGEYEIAEKILKFRHYKKLLSTYVDWILKILSDDDFIYTSYNQTVTTTGRLSSTKPNLQNIPVWEWVAWEIRSAFISRFEDWKIMWFDYSQVEVRILAIMSRDDHLLEVFRRWGDIHQATWEFIFEKKDISGAERKIAKAVNFWVIYWISAFGLSKMINISVKQAKIYIERFFLKYGEVKNFFNEIILEAEKNGYVESLFGRKRYIPWINDRNKMIKNAAEREAKNMWIQGTAADIMKLAMIEINNFMQNTEQKFKSQMIMQVHDEVIFDVFPWEEEILEKNVVEIMSQVLEKYWDYFIYTMKKEDLIDLKVDFSIWKTWKEAK